MTKFFDQAVRLSGTTSRRPRFSAGTIGLAKLGNEAPVLGKIEEQRFELMVAFPIVIPLNDNRLHVVV